MKYLAAAIISIILGGGLVTASAVRTHLAGSAVEAPASTIKWEIHYLDGRRMPGALSMEAPDIISAILQFQKNPPSPNATVICIADANWDTCSERDPNANHRLR